MAASSAGAKRSTGTLLLWLVAPLFELAGLLLVYAGLPDLVQHAGFGTPSTEVVVGCVLLVSVIGTVLAWRGVAGPLRVATAIALFVAAGVTAALGLRFATFGVQAVFTISWSTPQRWWP